MSSIFYSTPFELVKDLDLNTIAVSALLNKKAKQLGLKPTTPLLMLPSPLETGLNLLDEKLRGGFPVSTITELVGSPGMHARLA
jgi:RecA/RadA recombinase